MGRVIEVSKIEAPLWNASYLSPRFCRETTLRRHVAVTKNGAVLIFLQRKCGSNRGGGVEGVSRSKTSRSCRSSPVGQQLALNLGGGAKSRGSKE